MADNPLNPDLIPGSDKAEKQGLPTPKSVPKPESFQSYMKEGVTPTETEQVGAIKSPIELAGGPQSALGTPTASTLLNQVNTTQSAMNDLQSNLQTPNLKLKRAQEHILNNKLTQANEHLNSASQILGAKTLPSPQNTGRASPIEKFVSYVNQGQNQLLEAKKQLEDLKGKEESLKPGELMLIQVKLAQAQQSIEYSSVLLSKVVESFKTIITLQI